MRPTRHHARGVSLVEAMVALAVMAFGMLAVVGVQGTMRLNADIAKQRSEATRIAQEMIETQRAFTVIDSTAGQRAWSDISTSADTEVTGLTTNTTYRVARSVLTFANPPAKALMVTVRWDDRTGQPQQLTLSSAIAAAAPALSGTLGVRPGTASVAPVRRPYRRHPSIPVQARDFGTSSAWVPPYRPSIALVFNNLTGFIIGICNFGLTESSNETIAPADIQSCSNNTSAQLITGYVRFNRTTTGSDLLAADVENPPGPALRLVMRINLTSGGHPDTPFCADDADPYTTADGALQYASYFCVVYSNAAARWSGRTDVEPLTTYNAGVPLEWEISNDVSGGGIERFRVCRYTPATSDAQAIPNPAHPRDYTNVIGNLTNQNFVVISSSKTCPADVPANPAAGDLVNSNTLQHQPTP
jgi:Tfp pilus assembly protein PilV